MKKILGILTSTLLVTSTVSTAVSCNLFKPFKNPKAPVKPKNPDYRDPFDNNSNDLEQPKHFTYNNIKYNIFDEDTANPTNVYYANEVLEDNSSRFKKYIPDAEKYKFNDLSDTSDFPTISLISQYVRSLEHFNPNKPNESRFIWRDKNNKTPINSYEYNQLVSKVLDIINNQKELKDVIFDSNSVISKKKEASVDSVRMQQGYPKDPNSGDHKLWGELEEVTHGDGSKSGTYQFKEIPFTEKSNNLYNFGSKGVFRIPTGLWFYNRIIDFNGNFDNELFLSKEFFEKDPSRFNPKKMKLVWDGILDQILRNRIKVYAMQKAQLELLISFLEFQKALSSSSSLIADASKTLNEQLDSSGIQTRIKDFESKLLSYMQLKQLAGYMFEDVEVDEINLQLFPGTSFYDGGETDFRATYRWAWNEYQLIVQPLIFKLFSENTAKENFKQAFKGKYEKHYDFIWANIEAVDGVKKPHVISKSEADKKFNAFVKYCKQKFNWKFSKIE
ncbi:lipoprotein [Mycoplasma putrefaciens]|uniref:MAG3960 family lipoprotein n=1 Tax=Mycoplasma putrefaciens TaxID=2123 RepID=UPI003DA6B113